MRRFSRFRQFSKEFKAIMRLKMTTEEALGEIEARTKNRDDAFLGLLDRAVFQNPASPYLALFKLADCAYGDVENMVRRDGLESTLKALRHAGVYLSYEEFKGRTPIVRNGRTFESAAAAFNNPVVQDILTVRTGGSTGKSTTAHTGFSGRREATLAFIAMLGAHGYEGAPFGLWFGFPRIARPVGILPNIGSVERHFYCMPAEAAHGKAHRWRGVMMDLLARSCGAKLPTCETATVQDGLRVARWVRSMIDKHGKCVLGGYVSLLLRTSLAAQDAGIDLRGALFLGTAEPPTPEKVRRILACGAAWTSLYAFIEGGFVGVGCPHAVDETDTHFLPHTLAMIQHRRKVPGTDMEVDSFHFTSVAPSAAKILINVESDDCGIVEERACGCAFDRIGLSVHVRQISSFSKLTGEGMTLMGSEVLRILDEVLPNRFGGTPLDYQLAEEQDEQGFTRLILRVHPRVAVDQAMVDAVLNGIDDDEARKYGRRTATQAIWREAGTLQVRREEPLPTSGGKLLPLYLDRKE